MTECAKRLCTDKPEAGCSKQIEKAEEQISPFANGGKCDDEVKLVFDDKKELHVSKNFLILSSPVFEAMFRNDFSEKKNNLVKLPGKKYEDFLEFLDCINPGSLQDVNKCNTMRMAPIADEYQVKSVILKCKAIMKNLVLVMKNELKDQYSLFQRSPDEQLKSVRNCLYVLHTAISCCYEDFIEQCVGIASCYSSGIYGQNRKCSFSSEDDIRVQEECKQLFKTLPVEIRCQILSNRLCSLENNNVLSYSGK